jgi:GTP pyrophosphokinase
MVYETVTELDQLLDRVKSYNADADVAAVRKAYEFSAKAHKGQVRRSGEPYLQHPLAVAGVLTLLKTDVTAIVAGLLHDTLEDTLATSDELEREFGVEVMHLVSGVTKIGKITFRNYEEKQAENFRKMVLSMADDIRVVLIKLADRLHNMRTLEYLGERKRVEIAQETLEIYAPLANRLGIGWIKNELEDLCLKHLKPDVYETLRVRVAKRDEDRQQYIQEVIEVVKQSMADTGLPAEVYGRPKHLYGIYQKMEKQSITFEEVYDLAALRIITDTKMNCYAWLGVIHSLWRPLPGRFKDYIAIPKSNLYQSLHTTVVGPKGEHVEFQIRTEEMHRVCCSRASPIEAVRTRNSVSLGRPGRFHPPRPRRYAGTHPSRAAAPAGTRQAIGRGCRQDLAARPQRPRLPLADGPSGRAGFSFLRAGRQSRLSLLRRALRRRLPSAAASPRPASAATPALRRAEGALSARAQRSRREAPAE